MGTRSPEQLRRIIARLVRRIPKRPPGAFNPAATFCKDAGMTIWYVVKGTMVLQLGSLVVSAGRGKLLSYGYPAVSETQPGSFAGLFFLEISRFPNAP
jgi:hypothetical protein